MNNFSNICECLSKSKYLKSFGELNVFETHNIIADASKYLSFESIKKSSDEHKKTRRAFYFSAEFLVGRAVYNNLISLGLFEKVNNLLSDNGTDINIFEEIEDAALGNGGLGRLAACFMDSAATIGLPLDGYGIRYKYGLFRQKIENGFQKEYADNWTRFGDRWSVRKENESVTVSFQDGKVKAVPYDMPIFGYNTEHVSNIRLWQCEALDEFNFHSFNCGEYENAFKERIKAETITSVLYPNDNTPEGKILRLKQQYFFSSASLKDIIRAYKSTYGNNYEEFSKMVVIQLNDTHPVISIPELIRILMEDRVDFVSALQIAKEVFCYTNHTVMSEALEKWDAEIIRRVSSEIYDIIEMINDSFECEIKDQKVKFTDYKIIEDGKVNMAHLASFVSKHINGVAEIHTEIIKNDVLKSFNYLYPEKIKNITNGITQRRWLLLCNSELSDFITGLLKSDKWITELSELKKLKKYADDTDILERFAEIKENNKKALSRYTEKKDGFAFESSFIVDVQIKRLHEYKRQLLNILTVLEIYFELKEGSIVDFHPTVFIFAAKAAPGYERAKGIIKLINEVARLIDEDDGVSEIIKVKFLSDYNVSYAEKIIAAADVSEQISTAGTEASGTGNMKLMLNGAVTCGTFDGANIEIVKEAGKENNYIFGSDVEEIERIREEYNPELIMKNDYRIKRCLEALIDGTLVDGNTGAFEELYNSIVKGASWHKADHYFLLKDFDDYLKTRIRINNDYKNRNEFTKKCFLNMCSAGKFSSDRSVNDYARKIWNIDSV